MTCSQGYTRQNPNETPALLCYSQTHLKTGNSYFFRLVWQWSKLPHPDRPSPGSGVPWKWELIWPIQLSNGGGGGAWPTRANPPTRIRKFFREKENIKEA